MNQRVLTIALALAGAAIFHVAGLPLPFLLGPMAACLIAALAGAKLKGMGQISIAARTILGIAVGASITPELMIRAPQMAASVALIPVYVILIGAVGVPFFRRLGFDRPTSWYAAMPGGLQEMIAFGQEAGADPRALSLIHATRIAVIVTVSTIVLTQVYDANLTGPAGEPIEEIPLGEIVLMILAALIGWKGGERIGLFGAAILGPLIVTAALSLTGAINSRPPAEAIVIAQLLIGLEIGAQYVGVTMRETRTFIASGLAFVAILSALAFLFAQFATLAGLANPVEAFLSFAPGGQAEMTVLAIVAGADLGFVILHHLVRIVLVIVGAPIAARWMR